MMNYGSPGGVIAARCDYGAGRGGHRDVGDAAGPAESKLVPPARTCSRQVTRQGAWLPYAYRMPLPTFREGNLLCDLI